ncbi:MAG: hypothetical protein GWP08_06235 [Nitrospiraceae bacterium]|nr:hypothetical protein [Nitrospiraceae bacterium]
MRGVEPIVSEADAIAFFERPRWANLWGWYKRRPTGKGVPFVELIWLPHYLIPIAVNSRRGPGAIDVSVEAHSGAFSVVDAADGLVELDPAHAAIPPRIGEEEAVTRGRKELLKSIMRRRGQRHKPVIEGAGEPELYYYPYWIYYYERRRGLIDIRILDAVSKDPGRARTKVGVLSALAGSDEAARKALDHS